VPELPEVETVRRGLEPVLAGRRLTHVEQRRPDLRFPLPDRFPARLVGQRVTSLGRRAKYLLARLDGGEVLLMHLGMSGRFTIADSETSRPGHFVHDTGADPAHDHIVLHVEGGARITYNDPRRFGFMDLVAEEFLDKHKLMAGLGPEPLGNVFNAAYLANRAFERRTDLKALLLDQRVVAGLGNIYVCEALFRSGLSPARKASSLADRRGRPTERCERLVENIRDVLKDAIEAGGSTLRNYRHADGALGYFQHTFRVYGRQGEACLRERCAGMVRRRVQGGRSSFYCGTCQR
jgi:formamidopyrimidine-DNA glycosylase